MQEILTLCHLIVVSILGEEIVNSKQLGEILIFKNNFTAIVCVVLVISSAVFETETLLKMKLVVLLRVFILAF